MCARLDSAPFLTGLSSFPARKVSELAAHTSVISASLPRVLCWEHESALWGQIRNRANLRNGVALGRFASLVSCRPGHRGPAVLLILSFLVPSLWAFRSFPPFLRELGRSGQVFVGTVINYSAQKSATVTINIVNTVPAFSRTRESSDGADSVDFP